MGADVPPVLRYPWDEPPERGMALEVAPGVLWMRLPLPMKLDHVNVYALDDGDGWTLIDTGFDTGLTREIWTGLLAGPLAGKPVRRVVVTHHHPDHIGLAGWFQTDHGAELVTTRTAWLFARMLLLDNQPRPTAETLAFWRRAGMDPEIYAQRAEEKPFNYADIVAPMPLGFSRVKQGDVIEMGGRTWDVHIGNGHAPEHATFWSREDDLVIAGDQILSSISPNIGVYATEPEADPLAEWLEACERFLPLARADHLVLGGHKLPFTGLPFRLHQLIENHHGGLRRLLEFLQQPHVASDCFATLFKRRIGAGEYGLALVESVANVNHLYKAGLVSRTPRGDGAWLYQAKGAGDG
ncbi:MBL fold metallo-hydrolase [Sedimentitalea sp. JM2-8]|uniref:MBL fold metallo-hydrolase n=1 Tax=Sedimentitalea xiamensis TaxID=3050037 RepID=A0ABT7FAX1_9RHOB|nr:MBL fold metallo-hydrolase [Sedimentitalea xiamensis]MDK3072252.1 MBL fold metallo-hydrolase [Sedimentitalea xiamensis]